jgi:hypothetical protein
MVNIFIKEYRRQRNYVTKLKSKSINTNFIERRTGGPKSKDFWPTVKPKWVIYFPHVSVSNVIFVFAATRWTCMIAVKTLFDLNT